MQSVVIIWHRVGPYHLARLRGAADMGNARLTVIELSGRDATYAWNEVRSANGFERVTLFTDSDCDILSPHTVKRRLWEAFDKLHPDVVCIPSWGVNYAHAALAWCLHTGTPNVVMSASSYGDKHRVVWKENLKSLVVRNFQAALVGGHRQAQYVNKLGIPLERIWAGYDVIDNTHFSGAVRADDERVAARIHLGLPPRYFLSVSRFIRKKNLPVLLGAFAKFRQSLTPNARDWHLVLLGDGPLREELLDLRSKLGLDDFLHLPGFKQYDELPAYYGLAEAFLLASTEEQWGLVVNEAMAAGLPVVISNRCGCVPDLIREGENGFTFAPEDEAELARLIGCLAADDSARREMGRASQKIIADWTPQTFGRNLWKATEAVQSLPRPRHTLASRLLLPLLMSRRNRRDE